MIMTTAMTIKPTLSLTEPELLLRTIPTMIILVKIVMATQIVEQIGEDLELVVMNMSIATVTLSREEQSSVVVMSMSIATVTLSREGQSSVVVMSMSIVTVTLSREEQSSAVVKTIDTKRKSTESILIQEQSLLLTTPEMKSERTITIITNMDMVVRERLPRQLPLLSIANTRIMAMARITVMVDPAPPVGQGTLSTEAVVAPMSTTSIAMAAVVIIIQPALSPM